MYCVAQGPPVSPCATENTRGRARFHNSWLGDKLVVAECHVISLRHCNVMSDYRSYIMIGSSHKQQRCTLNATNRQFVGSEA